jgi:hypothetical protein
MAAAITTCTRSFLIAGLLETHQPDHGYQLGARITTGVALPAGSGDRSNASGRYLGRARRNTKSRRRGFR